MVSLEDPSGVPVDGATVTLWNRPAHQLRRSETGRDGVARFAPVTAGPHTVRAGAPGWSNAVAQYDMPDS